MTAWVIEPSLPLKVTSTAGSEIQKHPPPLTLPVSIADFAHPWWNSLLLSQTSPPCPIIFQSSMQSAHHPDQIST